MRRLRGVVLVAALFAVSLAAQGVVGQTAYTLTVSTAKSAYGPGDSIEISGMVSPPPGPSTGVFVKILNPSGTTVGVREASVVASTGAYNLTIVAGGTSSWTAGKYIVNATWGAYQPQLFATASFQYSPSGVTTSTTSSSSTTPSSTTSSITTTSTSSTTSTTSASSATSSSTVSTSKSGGIPEFPFGGMLVGVTGAIVVLAYALVRRDVRGP